MNINELKALLEKCTPGEWDNDDPDSVGCGEYFLASSTHDNEHAEADIKLMSMAKKLAQQVIDFDQIVTGSR